MGLQQNVKNLLANLGMMMTSDVKKFMYPLSYTDQQVKNNFTDFNSYLLSSSQVSWIYKCVSIIGEGVAMTDSYVYDKDNEVVENPILNNLFTMPNDYATWFEFKDGMMWYLLLTGNCYIYKDSPNKLKQPTKLWLIRPDYMEVVPSKTNFIAGYTYKVDGKKIPFAKEDIIHLKLFNPTNDFVGMGKIQAATTTYNTEIAAANYNWNFFANGATPSGILQNKGTMNEEAYNRLVKLFEKRHSGYKRMQRTLFLEDGTEYKQMGLSQQDMAFMEQRKFGCQEILAIFGVPPAKAGIMEFASYANVKEQENTYRKDTLKPYLVRIQQKLTNELIKAFNPTWKLEFDEVVERDEVLYMGLARDGIANGMLTPNEAREQYLAQPRVEGEESMDSYYMGFSLMPITGSGAIEAETPIAEVPPSETPSEGSARASVDGIKGCGCLSHKDNKSRASVQQALLKVALLTKKRLGVKIKKTAKANFEEQETRIVKLLENGGAEKAKDNLFNADELKKFQKDMIKAMLPVVSSALDNIINVMGNETEKSKFISNSKVDIFDEPVLQARIRKFGKRITGIYDTTVDQLDETLDEGIKAGESIAELKSRVSTVMGNRESWEALRIARTESAYAYDSGALFGYKELGVETLDVVGCTDDDYPCNSKGHTLEESEELDFHPNHIGTFVPSLE